MAKVGFYVLIIILRCLPMKEFTEPSMNSLSLGDESGNTAKKWDTW